MKIKITTIQTQSPTPSMIRKFVPFIEEHPFFLLVILSTVTKRIYLKHRHKERPHIGMDVELFFM